MNLKKKKGAYLQEMTIEIWRQKGIDYNWDREKPEVKKEESFEGVNSVSRKVKEKENWKKTPQPPASENSDSFFRSFAQHYVICCAWAFQLLIFALLLLYYHYFTLKLVLYKFEYYFIIL